MNPSAPFIRRPVATTLITAAFALAGLIAFGQLPVAPLPQVDLPTISVSASMPGASPDTMAADVAAPLEKHLSQIADVTEMTSSSSQGATGIVLQFGLGRDINGAARDVQAAINAARADLPASLRANPTYRKVNPADAPVMILALSSPTRTQGQLYDLASNVLQQALLPIKGVGDVGVGGSALPAVRVELNPGPLFKYGVGLEDIRAALASANANAPKGAFEPGDQHFQIYTNDQASKAADYRDLVVAWRNNAGIRLSDVADVVDGVEDVRNAGLADGHPAVLLQVFRQPGANIIETADLVRAALPQLSAALPADTNLALVLDRSTTIRAALWETEKTLLLAVLLVTLVVFVFLRNLRAALIPTIAVPVSIIGAFAAMWLDGASLDNLSLMALTISTGFVVDDAIVVLENISRHIEMGKSRLRAAFDGAREVAFTVTSINVSLVAVFVPILFMGGIVGRFFHEFAVTLSMAVMISLFVSLTATPMLCARFLPDAATGQHGRLYRAFEAIFDAAQRGYRRSLQFMLRHGYYVMLSLFVTIGFNAYLFTTSNYGLFPSEDVGVMIGGIQADQSISFQAMKGKLTQLQQIVASDPAVDHVAGFTGGRQANSGFIFASLKPLEERKVSVDLVAQRLRPRLAEVAGARVFLQGAADFRTGGRQSNAAYQFTLQSDDVTALYTWAPKLLAALQNINILTDVNSDRQQAGRQIDIAIDRDAVARLGLSLSAVDNTLYDAFGQRQVSTIYSAQNQYHVVMEVAPRFWQSPETLKDLWISTSGANASGAQRTNAVAGSFSAAAKASSAASTIAADSARNQAINAIATTGRGAASSGASVSTGQETMVPFSEVASYKPALTPLSVNHQGFFAATTLSFNLAPGHSLSEAQKAITDAIVEIGMPKSVQGSFAGTAGTFNKQLSDEPVLILAALAAIYIVLGILYESYVHPLTILSTLPSASVGAMLALRLFGLQFDIIAFIGVILLIGIVKKNAILMIDFAVAAQRTGMSPQEAVFEACMKRFRPIMMTTFAAMLGAMPLAFGTGEGSELRLPLGVAVVGGLIVSQLLTLYTTPVVYLYLDRISRFTGRLWQRIYFGKGPDLASEARS